MELESNDSYLRLDNAAPRTSKIIGFDSSDSADRALLSGVTNSYHTYDVYSGNRVHLKRKLRYWSRSVY